MEVVGSVCLLNKTSAVGSEVKLVVNFISNFGFEYSIETQVVIYQNLDAWEYLSF